MSSNIVKYNRNIFSRFFGKIRCMFSKKSEVKESEKEVDNLATRNLEKTISSEKEYDIYEVSNKYEASKVGKEKLTADEEKFLINYYKKRNEELDREIAYYRVELKKINNKITNYYKKAIEIKGITV